MHLSLNIDTLRKVAQLFSGTDSIVLCCNDQEFSIQGLHQNVDIVCKLLKFNFYIFQPSDFCATVNTAAFLKALDTPGSNVALIGQHNHLNIMIPRQGQMICSKLNAEQRDIDAYYAHIADTERPLVHIANFTMMSSELIAGWGDKTAIQYDNVGIKFSSSSKLGEHTVLYDVSSILQSAITTEVSNIDLQICAEGSVLNPANEMSISNSGVLILYPFYNGTLTYRTL